MFFRRALFAFSALAIISVIDSGVYAAEFVRFKEEPVIRIGLSTGARSVSITTGDTQLISNTPGEAPKLLQTAKISVAPRYYKPPQIELYDFEIPNIQTKEEADLMAAEAREATGEKVTTRLDAGSNTWRVRIGETKETIEEANEFKALLAEKGFAETEIVTTKFLQPSEDAIALTNQLKTNSNSEVRSLISSRPTNSNSNSAVRPAVSSAPTSDVSPPPIVPVVDANLKEIVVSGAGAASFASLKPLAFASTSERSIPVRVNGKAYRGRIEVFVNDRGSLTIVNAILMEDYLRGVVPAELSLPALEAQKAQAVAARTYAWANMNQFIKQGFDLLPTTRSQVYKGFSAETAMGTQAVNETRGVVASYQGKPINAMYTSTCGGRTENVENIYEFNHPYLRGVECSLEGRQQFDPVLVKTLREPAKIKDEANLELVRLISQFSVNGFLLNAPRFTDEWFAAAPTQNELSSWLGNMAFRFNRTGGAITADTAKPAEMARFLGLLVYGDAYADTLLSEADIAYQLSFADAAEVPKERRADVAMLMRDGWLSLYPDATLRPNQPMPRSRLIRLIYSIYAKKKWLPALQTGSTKTSVDGKLVLKSGKTEKQLSLRPDALLFRQFGDQYFQVKEIALIGGESVAYQTNALSEVTYLEVKPSAATATAEKASPFSTWNTNLSPSAAQSRLSRYVRGLGALYDLRVSKRGVSRRATELEIVTSNGTFKLAGGKIRSALRLKEQLFVINKRYDASGRAAAYNFTGRGWGHGIGMCQYGAFGLAKMGVKYDRIIKHYYTGVDLAKAY
jgi:stage II sporulation protein D